MRRYAHKAFFCGPGLKRKLSHIVESAEPIAPAFRSRMRLDGVKPRAPCLWMLFAALWLMNAVGLAHGSYGSARSWNCAGAINEYNPLVSLDGGSTINLKQAATWKGWTHVHNGVGIYASDCSGTGWDGGRCSAPERYPGGLGTARTYTGSVGGGSSVVITLAAEYVVDGNIDLSTCSYGPDLDARCFWQSGRVESYQCIMKRKPEGGWTHTHCKDHTGLALSNCGKTFTTLLCDGANRVALSVQGGCSDLSVLGGQVSKRGRTFRRNCKRTSRAL